MEHIRVVWPVACMYATLPVGKALFLVVFRFRRKPGDGERHCYVGGAENPSTIGGGRIGDGSNRWERLGAFITFICWLFKSCVIWFADIRQRYIPFWSDFRGTLGIVHVLHSCLKAFGTLNHRPISGGVKSTHGTVERVLNSAWD